MRVRHINLYILVFVPCGLWFDTRNVNHPNDFFPARSRTFRHDLIVPLLRNIFHRVMVCDKQFIGFQISVFQIIDL